MPEFKDMTKEEQIEALRRNGSIYTSSPWWVPTFGKMGIEPPGKKPSAPQENRHGE